jgi:hypothetical protein
MRESIPRFLNGVYSFVGAGYEKPSLLSGKLTYSVPPDKRTQLIYFRGGNSCDEMIYFVMTMDGVRCATLRLVQGLERTSRLPSSKTFARKRNSNCSLACLLAQQDTS